MEFNEIRDYIQGMNEKDRLKVAIKINETVYTNIDYDKKEMFKKFDTRLKEIDQDYRKTQNIPKHILMIVARITELNREEQNKIALYAFNIIK